MVRRLDHRRSLQRAARDQRSFGARSVAIEGLNNPVTVRQLDDINVEIFIDYQLNATVERP